MSQSNVFFFKRGIILLALTMTFSLSGEISANKGLEIAVMWLLEN